MPKLPPNDYYNFPPKKAPKKPQKTPPVKRQQHEVSRLTHVGEIVDDHVERVLTQLHIVVVGSDGVEQNGGTDVEAVVHELTTSVDQVIHLAPLCTEHHLADNVRS